MSVDQTFLITLDPRLARLLEELRSRHEGRNTPLMNNATRAAFTILSTMHETGERTTLSRTIEQLEEYSEGKFEFNRDAWTALILRVVTALRSNDPAEALKKIHVSTAPR